MERDITSCCEPICLYCGESMKTDYDEAHPFKYCDCEDYQKTETINKQIEELEKSKPKEKYVKETRKFLKCLKD